MQSRIVASSLGIYVFAAGAMFLGLVGGVGRFRGGLAARWAERPAA
jgi:hypothetical protein